MTLFQFYKKFDTNEKCINYLVQLRWGNSVSCPYCSNDRYYIVKSNAHYRKRPISETGNHPTCFKCANNGCGKKFSVVTGTIFNSLKVPMWQFFYLIFSSAINKKNVSSFQQATNLGIAQKTTWLMMAKIRSLCYQDEDLILSGEVEADETYLAMAKWKRPYKKKNLVRNKKLPVFGLIERKGKILIKVIPNKDRRTVQDIIFKHVEVDSKLFTDSAPCYFGLSSYYLHQIVNHRIGEYVRGEVYTNSIEAVWSHVKMAIKGTHHGVSKFHLQGYCDEIVYRMNNKHLSPLQKFEDLIKKGLTIGLVRGRHIFKNVKKNIQEEIAGIKKLRGIA